MLRRTPLVRRTPLATVSAKKANEATAGGKPVGTKKAPRNTGPDALAIETVWQRDKGRCGWCGWGIDPDSTRGLDWSVSHRRPRRMGGDPRSETNLPSNLVLVHGHALSLCHQEIESRRADSVHRGHLLHDGDVPSQRPIEHAVHGWCYLADDGSVSYEPPECAA